MSRLYHRPASAVRKTLPWTAPPADKLSHEYDRLHVRTNTDGFYMTRGGFYSALLPQNRRKNRYSNILPFERTRVKLSVLEGDSSTDYINANDVDRKVVASQFSYISTQAPIHDTIEDFWRMVVERQVRVIVMLTKEREGQHEKSSAYWEPRQYSTLQVSIVNESPLPKIDSIRRIVRVSLPSGQHVDVCHFQFLGWPDFGVPPSAEPVLELMDAMEQEAGSNASAPIVVHCSAGVGRSGSFLTIHIILSKIKAALQAGETLSSSPFADVLPLIETLRECRMMMVQKKDQYLFCHAAVGEGVENLLSQE